MNRLNVSFNGNSYGKYVHRKFYMKEENLEMYNISAYMTVATDVMFTQMSAKSGI